MAGKQNKNKPQSKPASNIASLYRDKDGTLPDISKLDMRPKNRLRNILLPAALILIIVLGIGWLSTILFRSGGEYRGNSVEVEFFGPEEITSGDEVTFTLRYSNLEKVSLNNVELVLRYPGAFTFKESKPVPSNDFQNSWNIGTLAAGESGKIEIVGTLVGEIGEIINIDSSVTFEPENFGSTFKETDTFSTQITDTLLELTIEGPQETVPEKQITYTIKYLNNSDHDLENLQIRADYPLGFVFQSAEPDPSVERFASETEEIQTNNFWHIESLDKLEEGEIKITGGYLPDNDVTKEFSVKFGFLRDEEFAIQQEKTFVTKLVKHNFVLDLIINGSDLDQAINFGNTLNYTIGYNNLGNQTLSDVVIVMNLDSEIIDWESISDNLGGQIDEESGTITWNKDVLPQLAAIGPLAQGGINFALRIKNFDELDRQSDELSVVSTAVANLGRIDNVESGVEVRSSDIKNSINTQVELRAEARYFNQDNIAVGSGPIPPVVGQKTTYRVYWLINNSFHRIQNVEVKTVLPDNVEFADKFLVSTGELVYSSTDNEVVWSIGNIPENKSFDEVNVWFDVILTPTSDQKGKIASLTNPVTLTATDAVTNSLVSTAVEAITSNLFNDPQASGKGIVIGIGE
ncbi:MAG: hypothetical protein COT81_02725 [Candidatus Buchananbacteria bacterium CG10_big_fil_rev_8_21_14_0_10_42_9]|uniref:DUF11 domain-containing protein n=1 Tax=Candidatus Buchananbacteria bacterium CG10_big_fil_rev_8_21_14_0_10_42_9 TaxID=1974526 RepID=A0A2H0W1D5_9BACT|nr:MAG: hypothetical protein COT81_02725 [Candidatus Buchananbacteria bacterium CG10_big_fil_rev_8_21_14_0_10_42_9]